MSAKREEARRAACDSSARATAAEAEARARVAAEAEARAQARKAEAEARGRAAEAEARSQAVAREQARDVMTCLRELGFRAGEARRAVEFSATLPEITLEERVRAALKFMCPKIRSHDRVMASLEART